MEIPNVERQEMETVADKHRVFMEMEIFEIYKSDDKKTLSIQDILGFEKKELKNIVFVFAKKYEKPN